MTLFDTLLLACIWTLASFACGSIASSRGRWGAGWTMLSLFASPIVGWGLFLWMGEKRKPVYRDRW